MFIRLLLIFTIVPVVELFVLLNVGRSIGVFPTIALILLTGIAGAYLTRVQGFDIMRRIQADMAQGRLPAEQLLDGAMILAGGITLLTPGFCTDILGFSLLVPFTRLYIKRFLRLWLQRMIESGSIRIHRH